MLEPLNAHGAGLLAKSFAREMATLALDISNHKGPLWGEMNKMRRREIRRTYATFTIALHRSVKDNELRKEAVKNFRQWYRNFYLIEWKISRGKL